MTVPMLPYFWAGLGGLTAVGLEFGFRSGVDWWRNLWWIAPTGLLVNFSVYQLLRTDHGWLASIVLFGLTTALLRIFISFIVLHEPVSAGNIVAAAVLATGALVKLLFR